jgi:hypothetical protein
MGEAEVLAVEVVKAGKKRSDRGVFFYYFRISVTVAYGSLSFKPFKP